MALLTLVLVTVTASAPDVSPTLTLCHDSDVGVMLRLG
jgi:hypothetical protein